MTPLRTGLALSVTAGVFYALCALVWALAPGPFLTFTNNLFHGMGFSRLVQPQPVRVAGVPCGAVGAEHMGAACGGRSSPGCSTA